MGFEQDFLKARKDFLTKINDKKPSDELLEIIDEDKTKNLVKKLDQVKGKRHSEMNTALNLFEGNRVAYIKRIIVQAAKETMADKIKSKAVKYGDALQLLVNDYEEECEKQRQAEMPPPPPPMPKPKVEASTNPIAAAAVKIMLGKISDGYRKRREKQLEVAMEVEKDCIEQRKQINVFIATLQKEVNQAAAYSRGGQVSAAAGLKVAGQGQVNKIKAILLAMKKNYHDSLEPFVKERNLKAEEVAKSLHIDIPDAHLKELPKIPAQHGKILTSALAHGAAAAKVIEECEELAEDGDSLYSQIVDIAGGKDFGKLFLDGATKMATRVKAIIDKAGAEAQKLQAILIPSLAKNLKIVVDKAPPERVAQAQTYVNNNTRLVKISLSECDDARKTAENIIAAEKSKIPPEILQGPSGKVVQQIEALLVKLTTLNATNTKTATPVLTEAEKLLK